MTCLHALNSNYHQLVSHAIEGIYRPPCERRGWLMLVVVLPGAMMALASKSDREEFEFDFLKITSVFYLYIIITVTQ